MLRDALTDRAPMKDDRRENTSVARVREMLGGYRVLDDRGREGLIAEYQSLTPVEIALLRSDEALADNLKSFRADHCKAFRLPFRQYAALLGVALFGVMVCVYAVLSGS